MYKQLVKDYFSFTKKERYAIGVLIALMFILFLVPRLISQKKPPVELVALKNGPDELAGLLKETAYPDSQRQRKQVPSYYEREKADGKAAAQKEVFFFDPNTLSPAGWQQLGLPGKTIKTIENYLSKGGRFRQKDDLGKIYGFPREDLERLLPYVRVNPPTAFTGQRKEHVPLANRQPYPQSKPPVPTAQTIDLNSTDTTALIALPGIGPVLATRIILFRDKLGGFYEVDQIKEVYGLPDSTFQRISPRLQVSPEGLHKININTAGVEVLKVHPYIRWNIANAIIQYRLQHGRFSSVEDVGLISIITPDLQKKVLPYLTVDE